MINSIISDGGGSKKKAKVTANGQLVVGALAFDETVFLELDATNTAYNFYEPKTGKQFVITAINMRADRGVSSNTDATVVIFEADGDTETTQDKVLFEEAMVRGEHTGLSGLNILVNAGKWVNATTTDDDIHMTIMGYYINEI